MRGVQLMKACTYHVLNKYLSADTAMPWKRVWVSSRWLKIQEPSVSEGEEKDVSSPGNEYVRWSLQSGHGADGPVGEKNGTLGLSREIPQLVKLGP